MNESLAGIQERIKQIGEIAGEVYSEGDIFFALLRCMKDYVEKTEKHESDFHKQFSEKS